MPFQLNSGILVVHGIIRPLAYVLALDLHPSQILFCLVFHKSSSKRGHLLNGCSCCYSCFPGIHFFKSCVLTLLTLMYLAFGLKIVNIPGVTIERGLINFQETWMKTVHTRKFARMSRFLFVICVVEVC